MAYNPVQPIRRKPGDKEPCDFVSGFFKLNSWAVMAMHIIVTFGDNIGNADEINVQMLSHED